MLVVKKNLLDMRTLVMLLIITVLIVVAIFIVRQNEAVNTVVTVEREPNNVYDRTITVVCDVDYDPYTFYDAYNRPSGHDIELIYELADRMGYNVKLFLLPWSKAILAAGDGRADLIMTAASSPQDYQNLDLSIPLVNDPFVAFGKKPFSEIGELYDKRLAVLEGTGCISGFIAPYHLEDNTVKYPSISEVFAAVRDGECDYAVVRYSVGRRAMADFAEAGIKAVGPTLLNNSVCIGVTKGKTELLGELNAAIISVSSDGTLSEISDKWLGHYVDTLTLDEFIRANLHVILYIICALILLFLLGYMLISRSMAGTKETMLKKLAERDQLTGLYNRAACENMIREMLAGSHADTDIHALLVLDVDNFKTINDTLGHMAGDEVLIKLAGGLSRLFRTGDIVGRLGGDEFFVFMTNCTSAQTAIQKAVQIGGIFNNEHALKDGSCCISTSVGIAVYPYQGESFAVLYKSADDALYEAKRRGKSGFAIMSESGEFVYHPFDPGETGAKEPG